MNYTCPVCGQVGNAHVEYMWDPYIGECEFDFYCKQCGYIEKMAYSPTYTSFERGAFNLNIKMMCARIKHFKRFIKTITSNYYINELWKHI